MHSDASHARVAAAPEAFGAARNRYTRVAIVLHWTIAACIVFNLATGFFMEGWPMPIRITAVMLHASSGLTVLMLTLVRVVWRLLHEPPPHPAGIKRWERNAAQLAHFMLYLAMVLMPLTGWAILSSHSPPGSPGALVEWSTPSAPPPGMPAHPAGPPPQMKFFNLLPIPMIGPIESIGREPGGLAPQAVLHDDFAHWHGVGAWLLLGLLILHVFAALKHQFIDKHAELARMGIGRGTAQSR